MRRDDIRSFILFGLFICAGLALYVGGWVASSHMEADAYNRITGAHVSTWDAMWIELRVQEGALE